MLKLVFVLKATTSRKDIYDPPNDTGKILQKKKSNKDISSPSTIELLLASKLINKSEFTDGLLDTSLLRLLRLLFDTLLRSSATIRRWENEKSKHHNKWLTDESIEQEILKNYSPQRVQSMIKSIDVDNKIKN